MIGIYFSNTPHHVTPFQLTQSLCKIVYGQPYDYLQPFIIAKVFLVKKKKLVRFF